MIDWQEIKVHVENLLLQVKLERDNVKYITIPTEQSCKLIYDEGLWTQSSSNSSKQLRVCVSAFVFADALVEGLVLHAALPEVFTGRRRRGMKCQHQFLLSGKGQRHGQRMRNAVTC